MTVAATLGGPGRRTRVAESPAGCDFRVGGEGVRIRGRVGAPRENFVGWVYADPDGGEHHVVNCSIADLRLTVEGDGRPQAGLAVTGGATYELGMRERDHGMRIEPHPDG